MRSGLAKHRSSVRRQQLAREMWMKKIACVKCTVYFYGDEGETLCPYCRRQVA